MIKGMKRYIRSNPHIALSVPTLLSFFAFVVNFIHAFKDGFIDENEFHALMHYAHGFESVILLALAMILRKKK
jgi:hypothetical protein